MNSEQKTKLSAKSTRMDRLVFEKGVNEQEREIILNGMVEYNAAHVPFTQEKEMLIVNWKLKDEKGNMAGAFMGRIYGWNAMEISIVWVHPDFRGQGLGRRLMEKAEAIARENNCTLLHLNTFDFQAPGFYEKLGFTVFGILDNSPAGHQMYFMKKEL